MRMTGSWHLYRPGERWRKQPGAARVVLEVAPTGDKEAWVAVCFAAPVVELVDERAGPVVAHLGPDLCRVDADLDEAVRRLGTVPPATELGDALLDQRVAAGIGNVYKSEACFAVGVDPGSPFGEVPADLRRRAWATAARQLQANLGQAERRTHPAGLAVYGRRGQPCHRCGTPIRMTRHGERARSTYWCPSCQPPSSAASCTLVKVFTRLGRVGRWPWSPRSWWSAPGSAGSRSHAACGVHPSR
jgi:endonuclease VIII